MSRPRRNEEVHRAWYWRVKSDPKQRKKWKDSDRKKYLRNKKKIVERVLGWRKKNPEKCLLYTRRCHYRKVAVRHGLDPAKFLADIETAFKVSDGLCDICRKKLNEPVIEHCHRTGLVRGIVCQQCNSGLGFFKDSVSLLKKAVDYLTRSKAFA